MNIVNLNDDNFQTEVLESKQTTLVDFYADWCGPCKMISPIIEELSDDFNGKAKICKLNVDKAEATASKFGVMSIPTLIVFKDGNKKEMIKGAVQKAEISNIINKHL